MSIETTNEPSLDYADAVPRLAERAERHTPGVLDMIEVDQRVNQSPSMWVPVNATAISYATSANASG